MRLPSLKNVQAFEAAARHLNFTRAGEDLNLTSAAISQRVVNLEKTLGFELFVRRGPKLVLTPEGQSCRPVLQRALTQMRNTVGLLQDMTISQILTLRTSPSFAQKWIMPRLKSFRTQYPDIDLRIITTTNSVSVEEGELIMAVYYGIDQKVGLASNLSVDTLFDERVFPVCSSNFLDDHGDINELQDLQRLPLIHDDTMTALGVFPNWRQWCDFFELGRVDTSKGLRFVTSGLALDAALDGHGIALGRGALVRDHLSNGRLVRPFTEVFPLRFEYQFVYPRSLSEREDFQCFRTWILDQAQMENVQRGA